MPHFLDDPLPIISLLALLAFLSRIPRVRRWLRGPSRRTRNIV